MKRSRKSYVFAFRRSWLTSVANSCGAFRYRDCETRLRNVASFFAYRKGCAVRPSALEHDVIRCNRHHALALCLSMIFTENRFPLFRIML